MNNITQVLRTFIFYSLSFCAIILNSQIPSNPLQDNSEEKKKKEMSLEEAYEALEKNDLEKKSEIIPNEELRYKLLVLTIEKGEAGKSKELLAMKRVHDYYKKHEQDTTQKIQQELDTCNERNARQALYTGALLSALGCTVCLGIYHLAHYMFKTASSGKPT